MIYQFKIQIKGITKPPVWRKVEVPSNYTFLQFHEVIQAVFGWYDYHLFEFTNKAYCGDIRISMPNEDDFDFDFGFAAKPQDASKVKLSQIFSDKQPKLLYVYDFGDDWIHEIKLESISDKSAEGPKCLSGKGTCPPEDCGGIYGYEAMKKALAGPASEETEELREWLGLEEDEEWDANSFDLEEANDYLTGIL